MDVTIQMHHYPIPGFTKLNVKLSDIEVVKQLKLTPEYKAYKNTAASFSFGECVDI